MRIAGIDKGFATVTPGEFKATIRVPIARNDVVARLKLSQDPFVKPRQQPKPERFAAKWRKSARGDVCAKADPRVKPRAFGRNAARASAGAQGQEMQQTRLFEGSGIVITNGTLWRSYDESWGRAGLCGLG